MVSTLGITFADKFGVDENWLQSKGVLNPTIDVDTPLFIDPFLLPESRHQEFSECAFNAYEAHFSEIFTLILKSQSKGDKLWKAALKKFKKSEAKGMSGTCLGYAKHSTKGRAFGPVLSQRALEWANEVIELGVKDPELFSSMSVFEEGIGADLISDMVASITLECILKFNNRIYSEIEAELGVKVPRQVVKLDKRDALLPINPMSNDGSPLILLPTDILKHLPMMDDATSLRDVAEENGELRDRVNEHITDIFKIRTKQEKAIIKDRAMENSAAFQTLLDLLKILEKKPYDTVNDPLGLLEWRINAQNAVAFHKLDIDDDETLPRLQRIENVVSKIIEQFQTLIEDNRLSRTLYANDQPRHERYAQLLFYAISVAYCDANDLDISPEADAGAGPIDFKFSTGKDKVLVEIKLSTNSQIVKGYEKQLEAYKNAEGAAKGHYVVIDVGKLGKKWEKLQKIVAENPKFAKHKKIYLIDGSVKPSASKID